VRIIGWMAYGHGHGMMDLDAMVMVVLNERPKRKNREMRLA
jgi:hypothetical protein